MLNLRESSHVIPRRILQHRPIPGIRRRFRLLPVILAILGLLVWMAAAPLQAQTAVSPCGAPTYNPRVDRALFLWQDCATQLWHLRVTPGSGTAAVSFAGNISATLPFASMRSFGFESGDLLETSDANLARYRLSVSNGNVDGLDFRLAQGATGCFNVPTPADRPLLLGSQRTRVRTPFSLTTLGPCVAPTGTQPNHARRQVHQRLLADAALYSARVVALVGH